MRLAGSDGQQTLGQLAEAENLPEPTVAKLLGFMRRAGVVDAVRGRNGGYILASGPDEISAGQVIRSVSGETVFGFPCRGGGEQEDCPRHRNCGLRPVWQHLEVRVAEVLEQTTIADLLKSEARARQELQDNWPLGG